VETERPRRSILVVEDDADLRAVTAAVLVINGYEVVEAADGEEALRRLRSDPTVGLILLDLRMPRMDGRAFRAEQLGDPALAAVPVVVVSGEADGSIAAAQLGTAYRQKPVGPEDLLALAAGYCDGTPARRAPLAASSL
jgi:CheY-like chemotaxis protein